MTQPKTRVPAPLYAAAGAGDLAYRQLRKLPAVVTDLSGKAATTTAELREKAAATLRTANITTLRDKTTVDFDVDRLREAAVRNATAVVAGAQAAQQRAVAVYGALVARGERVVGNGVVQAADTVNADIEATEPPAEVTAVPAKAAAAKPAAKATRPAKATKAGAPAKRTRAATTK
jgi:hypothetical protein